MTTGQSGYARKNRKSVNLSALAAERAGTRLRLIITR